MSGPLSEGDLEAFQRDGFTVLGGAFPREIAAAGCARVWERLDEEADDPSTWTEPFVHLKEVFVDAPFDQLMTPRLAAAFDQLNGRDRWQRHLFVGFWPVLFPGFHSPPWKRPEDSWFHVDGRDFHHRLCVPNQGLTTLFLFTDIEPGDGGTAIAVGSHHDVTRLLAAAEPEGLSFDELHDRLPPLDDYEYVELTGRAGDIALMHPHLIHATSGNTGERVRFACNPRFPLKEERRLERADGDYSFVERCMRHSLGRDEGILSR